MQEILKATAAMREGADTARKFGEDVSKTGNQFEKMAGAAVSSLGLVTTAAAAVAAGVTLLMGTARNEIAKTQEQAGIFAERTRTLNSALAAAGQIGSAPAIRQQLAALGEGGVGGRKFSAQEAESSFIAISSAVGARVSANDKVRAVQAALHARNAGMDETGANQVGINFAQFERQAGPGGDFNGQTEAQLRDLAYTSEVYKPGGLSDRDLRFVGRSTDKGAALKTLFGAAQSDENARALTSLQDLAEKRHTTIDALLANPGSLPPELRPLARNLARGIANAPAVSLAGAEAAFGAGDAPTKQEQSSEITTSTGNTTNAIQGPGASDIQNIRNIRRTLFERDHPSLRNVPGLSYFSEFAEAPGESAALDNSFGFSRTGDKERVKILEQIRDHLGDINKKTDPNTALKNNLPGQQ